MGVFINTDCKPYRFIRFCDFCAADVDSVSMLIAGDSGNHICDVCVDKCAEVVAEKRAAPPPKQQETL